MTTGPTLGDRLAERIATEGALPFEEFMEACLYDPAVGFFTTGPLRSVESGDFLTSPGVSPWFGRALARLVDETWERIGRPDSLLVADVGAGSGSLLTALLESVRAPVQAWAVERSRSARLALVGVVPSERVVDDVDDVPLGGSAIVIGNELLDNFPVALAVRTADGWRERWVGAAPDGLALVEVEARPDVAAWADRYGKDVSPGGVVEVQTAACAWLQRTVGRIAAGAVVMADYGGSGAELAHRRAAGTLRTYRSHHLGPDPLLEPGATDITVDVDFDAAAEAARAGGAEVAVMRQDDFLARYGVRDVVARLRRRELELARDGGDPLERLRVRSERTDAETLLHPRGLGDFRVLVARLGPHSDSPDSSRDESGDGQRA